MRAWTVEEVHQRRVKRLRRYWAIAKEPCRLCGSKESFITHWCQEPPKTAEDVVDEALTIEADRFKAPWVAHQSGRGNWIVDGRFANSSDAARVARQVRQRTKRKTVIVEAATRQQLLRTLDSGALV